MMNLFIPIKSIRNKRVVNLKKVAFINVFNIALVLVSCNKSDCNCTNPWDINTTYIEDDLVSHNQKCWIAIAQGKGIEPAPWLYNGNDIWEECNH
jgi:hypothetical protein